MKEAIGPEHFLGVIDHTYLKTEKEGHSSEQQLGHVQELVKEAHEGKVFGVCVRENMVKTARKLLNDLNSPVALVSVIGFPCGDDFPTQRKIELLNEARENGANEFDIVFNYLQFFRGERDKVFQDLLQVSVAAGANVLKVIFENSIFPNFEKKEEAYILTKEAFAQAKIKGGATGFRFFKTSTGFVKGGATLEDMALMRKVAGDGIGLKPSGGITDFATALKFLEVAGRPLLQKPRGLAIDPFRFRIGTSSLLRELKKTLANK